MSDNSDFTARLARIEAEAKARGAHREAPAPSALRTRRSDGGMNRTGPVPMLIASLVFLSVGAFALWAKLGHPMENPFDLKTALRNRMTEEERANLRSNPAIEREIAKRKFADPDLARMILSN